MPWSAIGRLPLPLLYAISHMLYLAMVYVLRYRKEVVSCNLSRAFPDISEPERRQIARGFFRHLSEVAVEVLAAGHLPAAEFSRRVLIADTTSLASQLQRGPVLIATLHKGNAEWALHALRLQLGAAFDPVYKPPHNRGLARYLLRMRSRFGALPVPTTASTGEWRRVLRRGHSICLLADQSPVAGQPQRTFRLLNRETAFHTGLERLASLLDCPVFFADINRIRRGYYRVDINRLDGGTAGGPAANLMTAYVDACEQAILRQPESWLWSHRRWRDDPARSAQSQPVKPV